MSSQSISPLSDIFFQHSDTNEDYSLHKSTFPRCYDWMPCMQLQSNPPPFDSRSNWWELITENNGDSRRGCKRVTPFKKMKEWSWKSFIRKFNKKHAKQLKFQYDLTNYSLNFDEGQLAYSEDNDVCFRDFTSRYASIPISTKCCMDLGKDA